MEETEKQLLVEAEFDGPKQDGLIEPYNPLDPIVVFDPEWENSSIVVEWAPMKNDDEDYQDGLLEQKINILKNDAIAYPLIRLNNTVLEKQQVKNFRLSLTDFLPKLYLEISDVDGSIQISDLPGVNNTITFIMTAPVEGASKKITMDFYITSCSFNNGLGIYEAEYKRMDLQKTQCKQIGDSQLSTYEMLSNIAKECQLGFAASPGCEDISDKKWRQIYSQTYDNFLSEQLSFAGIDENSVMDAWVDTFGYLVMVNLSKIFNDEIDPAQLVTKITTGIRNDESNNIMPEQGIMETQRLLNNYDGSGSNNLKISRIQTFISNNEVRNHGTLNTLYYLTNPCTSNNINTIQTQIIENSVDGIVGSQEYEYTQDIFMGIDMSDDGTQLLQKEIVNAFRLKYFNDQLIIELENANYSLQRGMLIGVSIFEYNQNNKKMILQNYDNAFATDIHETKGAEYESQSGETQQDFQLDEQAPIMNPAQSGLYYINGIEFEFSKDHSDILQRLYVVRKGLRSKLTNKYTFTTLDKNELETNVEQ